MSTLQRSFEDWPAHIRLYLASHQKALGFLAVQKSLYPEYVTPTESTILYGPSNKPISLTCFEADVVDISLSKWLIGEKLGDASSHNQLSFRFNAYKDGQPFIASPQDQVAALAHCYANANEYALVLSLEAPPYITGYTGHAYCEEGDRYLLSDEDASAFDAVLADLKVME